MVAVLVAWVVADEVALGDTPAEHEARWQTQLQVLQTLEVVVVELTQKISRLAPEDPV
jgi:hypothetical protein